jgi:hypothetical protein
MAPWDASMARFQAQLSSPVASNPRRFLNHRASCYIDDEAIEDFLSLDDL